MFYICLYYLCFFSLKEVLDRIMEKYNSKSPESSNENKNTLTNVPTKKDLTSQDIIAKCESMINRTDQLYGKSSIKNYDGSLGTSVHDYISSNANKNRLKEATVGDDAFSSDDVFNDDVVAAIEKNVEETLKCKTAVSYNDIVQNLDTKTASCSSEPNTPIIKNSILSESLFINTKTNSPHAQKFDCKGGTQLSVSLFTNSENYMKSLKQQTTCKNEQQSAPFHVMHENVFENNDQDNEELTSETSNTHCVDEVLPKYNQDNKINVLQDIVIIKNCADNFGNGSVDSESETKKTEDIIYETDEDMFSDADIIETTPQKCKPNFVNER